MMSPGAARRDSPDRCDDQRRGPPDGADALEFSIEDLADVRELVRRRSRGALGGRESDLVLAVHELAANSIRHGGGQGVLQIWTTDGDLVCEVSDRGHVIDALAGRRGRPDAAGGRGLWLVHQLCDLVEMRSGPDGTRTRVHMSTVTPGDD